MAIHRTVGFGDLLRRYRARADLTQEQLAERAGLSVRGISDLERGVNRAPYRTTVARLAEALDLQGAEREALERLSSRYGRDHMDASPGTSIHAQASSFLPLVGREREHEILRRHVQGDLAPLLVIAGEPGIGKTRLLRAVDGLAGEFGLPVLRAGCQRAASEQPYAPLVDALSTCVHGLSSAEVRTALKGSGWLSHLIPELSDLVRAPQPVGDLSPEAERRLLKGAVTRFLQNIAVPGGIVLVLDDLQWAGRDGLELLLVLCRSAHETGLRVVGAYRSTETTASDSLSTMLADAAHAGLVRQIVLGPLSGEESDQLMDILAPDLLSQEARQQVLARSGGVPFFLVSCVSAMSTGDTAGGAAVPWTLAQTVRQRVASLPEVAQEVLAVAATVGRVVPTGLIGTVLGHPPAVLVAAIDATCRAGLLTEHDGRNYAFTHDVIREVIEADLGSARRTYLHLAIADALERAPDGPTERQAAELARHFEHGDDAARALPYALLAGDRAAAIYAHREAAELYGAATRFAAAIGDQRAEAQASEKAGRELTMVAAYAAAVTCLDRAASLYRATDDVEGEARVVAQLGWTHFYRATPNEAVARVETLVDQLRDGDPSFSLARLYITLTFLWYADRPNEALVAAEQACRIAEQLGDNRLLAAAQVRYGLLLGRVGRWKEGELTLVGVAALAERIGDIESLAYALGFAGIACSMQGKIEESCAYFVRGTGIAEQFGDPTAVAYGLRACGAAYFALGEWEQARAYLDRARETDATTSASTFSALIPLQTMELAVAQGRWEEVDELAAHCLELERNQRNDRIDTNLLCLLAEYDLLRDRPQIALARLEPRLDDFYCDEAVNLGVRTSPIEVCLAVGHLKRANLLLSRYADLIAKQGNRRAEPAMLRARGMVRAADGRLQEAEAAFREASDLACRMRYPLAHARILLEWSRTSRSAGKADQAVALAGEAEDVFRRLGAAPYAAEAAQLAGESPPKSAAG